MNEQPEFYAPWRLTPPYKSGSHWVLWDDNGNPMAYSESPTFLAEAVKRINAYENLLSIAYDVARGNFNQADVIERARRAVAIARGEEA